MNRLAFRAFIATFVCLGFSLPAKADVIGNSMVSFLQGKLSARVGGGECAHMVIEALRASGGEFAKSDLGADSPSSGDYVWGTLVTTISYANNTRTDSNPSNLVQPGDVIQYRSATFTYSKTSKQSFPQHTSVVAAVNSAGRPTSVFQQNFGGVRTVKSATIDTTKLTAGWIRIYRPITRIDTNNKWKITIVNNAATSQTVQIKVGINVVSTLTLSAANSAGSFMVYGVTTSGTVPCLVLSDNQSLFLQQAKSDEIYNPTTNTIAVRQLSQ